MHDTITYFFTKIIGGAVKQLLLLALLGNILMARPPHEVTQITRPFSPLVPDLELYLRVSGLISERRKALVHAQDSTLVALMEALKYAYTLAANMPENPTREVDDADIRRAIKYLDNENFKTKIL